MTTTLGFFLQHGFSTLAYASAVEPFRVSNQLLGEERFRVISMAASPVVVSSEGLSISVEQTLSVPAAINGLILCGGQLPAAASSETVAWLKSHAAGFDWIAGVAGGVYALLEAGLLKSCRASVPPVPQSLVQHLQDVRLSADLFSVDRHIWTCRGGTAAQDMMLFMLSRLEGVSLSELVAQTLNRFRVGEPLAGVRIRPDEALRREQPHLMEAVELMEANTEEPLTTDDIASHLGISRRQLERWFKRYLDSVPSRYYLQIRLEKARSLLLKSSLSVTEIALQCGFSSGAHFSTSYRSMYGMTPTEERLSAQS